MYHHISVSYTHLNNNYNCNDKNYRDYHKRCTKVCSTVYVKHIQRTTRVGQVSYAITSGDRRVTRYNGILTRQECKTEMVHGGYYATKEQ